MDTLGSMVADSAHWEQELRDFFERLSKRFGQRKMLAHATDYVKGLLSPVERKNGWQLAEALEQCDPYGIQHLLNRAHWDAELVRDDVRQYVVDALGHDDGVLAIDETGFLKKGTHSAGVGRQYSGTAGRIENCQIGVFWLMPVDPDAH